jgi:hypothetical protein
VTSAEVEIQHLFEAFEQASESEEWSRFEHLFLPTFLSLDPDSAAPVERGALIAFLPHRRGVFARAGATGTSLASLEVVPLDDFHVWAHTTWDVLYEDPHEPVTLRSSFLVRRGADGWRIAVYLNHESLVRLLSGDQT